MLMLYFLVILGLCIWKIEDYFHTGALLTKVIISGRALANAFYMENSID